MAVAKPMMFSKKLSALLIIAAVVTLVVPDNTENDAATSKAHYILINSVLIMLTVLVSISLTFEFIQHKLHHHTDEIFIPVLEALNSELMGLGFLAIILYFMIKTKAIITISTNTLCDDCNPCSGGPSPPKKPYYCPTYLYTENGETKYNISNVAYNATHFKKKYHTVKYIGNAKRTLRGVGQSKYTESFIHPNRRLGGALKVPKASFNYTCLKIQQSYSYVKNESASTTTSNSSRGTSARRLSEYEKDTSIFDARSRPPHTLSRRLIEAMMGADFQTIDEKHAAVWGAENWQNYQSTWQSRNYHGPFNMFQRTLPNRGAALSGRRLAAGPVYTCECYHCNEELLHLYENVHMTLFLVLVLYFCRSVLLLYQVTLKSKEWKTFEDKILAKGEAAVIREYYEQRNAGGGGSIMEMIFGENQEMIEFTLLRKRFIRTGNSGKPLEEGNFSFSMYLSIIYGHEASHVVHIPPKAWLVIELFFVAFYACMQAPPNIRLRFFILFFWVLAGLGALLLARMRWTLDQLLTPYPRNWPPSGASKYEAHEADLMHTLENGTPPYVHRKSKGHGKHANKHTSLFISIEPLMDGEELMMQAIRLLVLSSLIFLILSIWAFPHAQKYDPNIMPVLILTLVVIIPANIFIPTEMMRLYTLIMSVELMKNPPVIDETVRKVKFAKSMRTIRMLKSLQGFVKGKKKEGPVKEIDPARPMTDAEISRQVELRETFNIFDADDSGEVDMNELGNLMKALGMTMSDDDKTLIMKEFDKSGDNKISFDEFWAYMRGRGEEMDSAQIVEGVFALIDNDGSGNISASEFTSVLRNLEVPISQQEIDELIKEIDSSGDGQINQHEFAEVLNKYK